MADTSGQLTSAVRAFVFPVIVLQLTNSVRLSGICASISTLGMALSMPFGGWIQDRFDRRRLLIVWGFSGLLLFVAADLVVVAGGSGENLWILLSAAFGIRGGLLGSVSNVILRSVVPRERLPSAMALQDGRDAALDLAGAPLGGALLSVGRSLPFTLSAVLSLVSSIFSFMIPRVKEVSDADGFQLRGSGGVIKSFAAGFSWLRGNTFSLALALFGTPIISVFNVIILIAGLDLTRRGIRPGIVGLAYSSSASGALIGAVLVKPLMKRIKGGHLVLMAFIAPPLCTLLSTIPSAPWGRIALFFPAFLLLPCGNAIVGAIQIAIIPDRILGRVFAAIGLFEGVLSSVLAWSGAQSLANFGYVKSCVYAALLCIVLLISLLAITKLHRIPHSSELTEYSAKVA